MTLSQRQKMALARPTDHGLPFTTWSLPRLAEFLVAKGVVDDISHEGLRLLLREENVSFPAAKTWVTSTDPDYEAKNQVLELRHRRRSKRSGTGRPDSGGLHGRSRAAEPATAPGQQCAPVAAGKGSTSAPQRRTRRATYSRPHGVRNLLAGYNLSRDELYGHITTRKGRTEFLAFCRYLRSLHPAEVRIAIVLDDFSPPEHQDRQSCRGLGRGEQRRVGLRPVPRQLAQPHRGPVHRGALLRPERHRPLQPR